ncbi:MAG: hypothetical protein HUU15_12625 [Candidatus Brocadiae bacterium]|nr:hypothetical protein [Candidatus Brocadiia bacterium]
MSPQRTHYIVKIESFEGADRHLWCGDDDSGQDYLFCVVAAQEDGTAEIVDTGYRTLQEVQEAWPEIMSGGKATS